MRTAYFQRLQTLLADGEWHSRVEVSTIVSEPDRWVRQLDTEGLIELRHDQPDVLIRWRDTTPARRS